MEALGGVAFRGSKGCHTEVRHFATGSGDCLSMAEQSSIVDYHCSSKQHNAREVSEPPLYARCGLGRLQGEVEPTVRSRVLIALLPQHARG